VTDAQSRRIVEFATQQRLPGIYPMRHFVEGGGLMSYGPSLFDTWKRSAVYVDISKYVGRVKSFPLAV
jgi:putative tryptophan/tyrosine transport system substrate-binding protein